MRLTSRGWGLLALLSLTGSLAVSLRLPELFSLTAGLGVLMLVAVTTVATGARVDVTPPTAVRVGRGTRATLDIALLDHGRRPLGGMRMRADGAVVGLPRLRPGVPVVAALPIPTQRRGPVVMGPWSVERVDPWLLLHRTVTRVPPVEVVVVPRIHAVALGAMPMVSDDTSRSRDLGVGDVSGLREYVVGDEPRRIHWRSSAKAGTLMVTQQVEATRPGVHVVLDVARQSYAGEDEFEEAVDAAASVAVSAALTGVQVDLVTTAGEGARAGSGRHAGIMELLARVTLAESAGDARRAPQGTVIGVTGSRGRSLDQWGARTLVQVGVAASASAMRIGVPRAADLATVSITGSRAR